LTESPTVVEKEPLMAQTSLTESLRAVEKVHLKERTLLTVSPTVVEKEPLMEQIPLTERSLVAEKVRLKEQNLPTVLEKVCETLQILLWERLMVAKSHLICYYLSLVRKTPLLKDVRSGEKFLLVHQKVAVLGLMAL
jgi:hypothetical protein